MVFIDQEKPLEEVVHFGVKGMHWGVRAQRRIDKRIANGKTPEQAMRTEQRRKMIVRTAAVVYAAVIAKNLFEKHGQQLVSSIVTSKLAKNGAKAAANALADSRGLTSYSAISLSFNAAKNIWE